MLFYVIK